MNKYSPRLQAYKDMKNQFTHLHDTWGRINYSIGDHITEDYELYSHRLLTEDEILDMDEFHYQCDLNPVEI